VKKRLFVGNLNYKTTEEDIRSFFGKKGPVEYTSIIKDKWSGQSKGFGFVEMKTEAAAQSAIALDGCEFMGRKLTVNEAKDRQTQDRREKAPAR
jgi:RNA recognition motif-containing protein